MTPLSTAAERDSIPATGAPAGPRGLALLAGILSLAPCGCGYTLGYHTPPGASTIGIPIFHNATFGLRRDLEFQLTSLVRREIQSRTPLTVVPEEGADLVLRGTIVDFRENLVSEGRRDRKVESSVVAVVRVVLEDYRNGHVRTSSVRTQEPFSPALGEDIDDARQLALENLAERIVAAVEYWGDEESR